MDLSKNKPLHRRASVPGLTIEGGDDPVPHSLGNPRETHVQSRCPTRNSPGCSKFWRQCHRSFTLVAGTGDNIQNCFCLGLAKPKASTSPSGKPENPLVPRSPGRTEACSTHTETPPSRGGWRTGDPTSRRRNPGHNFKRFGVWIRNLVKNIEGLTADGLAMHLPGRSRSALADLYHLPSCFLGLARVRPAAD